MRDSNSRVYCFARQGNERTVAVVGTDADGFALVTLLPIPVGFMADPEGNLISMAEDQAATCRAIPRVVKLPAAGGAEGDPCSSFSTLRELQQVRATHGSPLELQGIPRLQTLSDQQPWNRFAFLPCFRIACCW